MSNTIEAKSKFRTTDGKALTVTNVAKKGRGYTVSYKARGEAEQSAPLAAFRKLIGNNDAYVAA